MLQPKGIGYLNGEESMVPIYAAYKRTTSEQDLQRLKEKVWEKNKPGKKTGESSWGSNTYIRQNRFQNKGHKKRHRRTLHNIQGKNPTRRCKHYKYICTLYVNIGALKYIRKILEDFKKDIDRNTITVGDFNTPLSNTDRSSKQNMKKDIVSLNNTLEEMDLTDI